jgi:hypothetical protein
VAMDNTVSSPPEALQHPLLHSTNKARYNLYMMCLDVSDMYNSPTAEPEVVQTRAEAGTCMKCTLGNSRQTNVQYMSILTLMTIL